MIDYNLFEIIFAYNCFINKEYLLTVVDFYDPKFFDNKDIKNFLNILIPFFKRNNEIPNLTELKLQINSDEIKESIVNCFQLFKTIDKKYNENELLNLTEKFLKEKSVYNALLETSKETKLDPQIILERFEKACNISLIDNLGFNYFESIDQHIEELKTKIDTISTGWTWLDEKLGGGWLKDGKALYVFTGFTNVGKSIVLGNIGINALKQNKTVFIFTLEMSELIYSRRISSQLSKIPFNDLYKNTEELKAKILAFKNNYINAKLIIKEFPTRSVTVNHINNFIIKASKKGIKPDIIIVDYLSILKPTKNYTNTYDEGKHISEQLRATSYLFNCPVITAAQLNRKGANKELPEINTISESIAVSFTADAQFCIWATDDDKTIGLIHLGIQKNRFGPNFGSKSFKIDYPTLSIEETNDKIMDSFDNNESNNINDLIKNDLKEFKIDN